MQTNAFAIKLKYAHVLMIVIVHPAKAKNTLADKFETPSGVSFFLILF
tara:strand:- start:213 stop:356 length:144 start_codon:yes stop_codon:yes gene_type:complete